MKKKVDHRTLALVRELKNCPFCGGVNVSISEGEVLKTKAPHYYVECCDCGAMGPPGGEDPSWAADQWDERVV